MNQYAFFNVRTPVIIVVLFVVLHTHSHDAQKPVSIVNAFDNPFPSTPLKKVCDCIVGIYSCLEHLCSANSTKLDEELVQDALLGRSIRLDQALDELLQEHAQGKKHYNQDIYYALLLLNDSIMSSPAQHLNPSTKDILATCLTKLSALVAQ